MKKKIIISFVILFLLFFAGIVTTLHIINTNHKSHRPAHAAQG